MEGMFSDIDIYSADSSLLYIDGIPLLKKIKNKYYLNVVQRINSYGVDWILGNSDSIPISKTITKKLKKQNTKNPITKKLNSTQSMYRGDVVSSYGSITSLHALTIVQLSVGMIPMNKIKGREHLVFTYGSNLPSKWDGLSRPTTLDALTTLYYAVKKPGYEDPLVYTTTHYEDNNISIDLDHNWKIEIVDETLNFTKNSLTIANIVPKTGEQRYNVEDFTQNKEKVLSKDWSIYYPDPSNNTILDNFDKQLKFMYKNYIQTTIIPNQENLKTRKTINNMKLSLGKFWKLYTDKDSIEFYYRESESSSYVSQMYIGNAIN